MLRWFPPFERRGLSMSARARWAVRIVMAGFGLLIGGFSVIDAVQAATRLSTAEDDAAHRALLVLLIGGVLKGVGLAGVFVFQAIGFRDWATYRRPLRPFADGRGGVRAARRAGRQINGVEPYRADEIAQLRQFAEYRVSARELDLAGRAGAISLIVFFVGIGLAPPELGTGAATESVVGQAFRVLAIVMTVVLVTSCVVLWRGRPDRKAEAFLDRTALVPGSAEGDR